ncbi:hypothetical protein B296_00019400 [Ensete ventricosum]|uniref:Bromo domain-containing protein n=1 Tax=Ensete ventricosum TaxID=4639 RepID=A0A426ZBQ8_ENSVE|nr:hypothetical protein B296_00019400 [Ensete ventricosum]
MASALLASSNEPCWGETKVYMRKNPISNPNPRPCPNLCTVDYAGDRTARFRTAEQEEAPPVATAVVSDDSSSFNRRPADLNHRRDPGAGGSGRYVTFNISAYSKTELRELKRRLVSELDQVRSLMIRIQSREIQSSTRSAGFGASGIYPGGGREVTSSAGLPPLEPWASKPSGTFSAKANKDSESEKHLAAMMKKCGQILSKLMKHKKSIWFNTPVDVVGMGLHDYFQIIKAPMDLGTVKKKLHKGLYPSPAEFASDVRLTFNNALLYNPKGHEVFKLAEQFLRHFEGLFGPSFHKYEKQQEEQCRVSTEAAPSPDSLLPIPASPAVYSPPPVPVVAPPPPQQQLQLQYPHVGRTTLVKLPKPKAKDPNKRPMSMEEKQKLSEGLQNLPPEKMSHVLHIVRKGNVSTTQNGDEIELDIDTMDTETLWALDRFLCNCKKMMSKMKRQEAIANGLLLHAGHAAARHQAEGGGEMSPVLVDASEVAAAKKSKRGGDTAEEDVDIGDELPITNYPPVEIQKDTGYATSSSSSDSDSSSSSGSDSGSSSEGDSDEEENEARSPAAGVRSQRD